MGAMCLNFSKLWTETAVPNVSPRTAVNRLGKLVVEEPRTRYSGIRVRDRNHLQKFRQSARSLRTPRNRLDGEENGVMLRARRRRQTGRVMNTRDRPPLRVRPARRPRPLCPSVVPARVASINKDGRVTGVKHKVFPLNKLTTHTGEEMGRRKAWTRGGWGGSPKARQELDESLACFTVATASRASNVKKGVASRTNKGCVPSVLFQPDRSGDYIAHNGEEVAKTPRVRPCACDVPTTDFRDEQASGRGSLKRPRRAIGDPPGGVIKLDVGEFG